MQGLKRFRSLELGINFGPLVTPMEKRKEQSADAQILMYMVYCNLCSAGLQDALDVCLVYLVRSFMLTEGAQR